MERQAWLVFFLCCVVLFSFAPAPSPPWGAQSAVREQYAAFWQEVQEEVAALLGDLLQAQLRSNQGTGASAKGWVPLRACVPGSPALLGLPPAPCLGAASSQPRLCLPPLLL